MSAPNASVQRSAQRCRRHRRRAVASIIPALLAVVLIAPALRSCTRFDRLEWRRGRFEAEPDGSEHRFRAVTWALQQRRGVVEAMRSEYVSIAPQRSGLHGWEEWGGLHTMHMAAGPIRREPWRLRSATEWRLLGLGIWSDLRQGETTRVVQAPHALLIAMLLLPGTVVLLAVHRRRRRRRDGRCEACGYPMADASVPCPECGMGGPRAGARV